jgi:hypothetical protein
VAQDAQLGVFFAHARAIVPDQHALAATIGYLYLYTCGTGVQGIFREFLHHRSGAVDDLSGGYPLSYQGSSTAT